MLAQTLKPACWLIVDDGSSDGTYDLACQTAARHSWIRVVKNLDRGKRLLGAGVIQAFNLGLSALDFTPDFVGKLDGDMSFGPAYLETLLSHFDSNPRLGAASGKVFRPEADGLIEEFMIDEMVAGQFKFYRMECFSAIDGFIEAVMWDGIDFHRARQTGWMTCSFADENLKLIHHRLMGSSDKNVLRGRLRWGRGQWFMGSTLPYIAASAAWRTCEKPYIIGGLCILLGYLHGMLCLQSRYDYPGFREELRRWQYARLTHLLTRGVVR